MNLFHIDLMNDANKISYSLIYYQNMDMHILLEFIYLLILKKMVLVGLFM